MDRFKDRFQAGQRLGHELAGHLGRNSLVLGLTTGGVPIAFEVARTMQLAMDIFVVRKLGVPGQEELSMEAIASGGVRMLNEDAIRSLNIPDQQIAMAGAQAHRELQDCETAYRGNYQELDIQGHEVILVDDGLATGASMIAAVAAIKAQHPARLTAAVPTGSLEACRKLQTKVDALVCIIRPEPFYSVGYWYEDYSAVTAEQIKQLLGKTRR